MIDKILNKFPVNRLNWMLRNRGKIIIITIVVLIVLDFTLLDVIRKVSSNAESNHIIYDFYLKDKRTYLD